MTTDHGLWHLLAQLAAGACVTVQIAALAIAIGLIGGTIVGIANCQHLRRPVLGSIIDFFVWAVRGTPLFVQVLIMYYAVPDLVGLSCSPYTAGVMALGINSVAYSSEIIRGGINGIPVGQWEAAYALGLPLQKTVNGIILPQVLHLVLPSLTNEVVTLVKDSSILMIIGVCELTKVSKDIVSRELNPISVYCVTAACYLIMASLVSSLAKWVAKRRTP